MTDIPKSPPDLRVVDARTGRISQPWLRWFTHTTDILRNAVIGVLGGTVGNVAKIAELGALVDAGFMADDVCILTGRPGGQTIQGGTAASNNLTIESTSNATKGDILCKDRFRLDTAGYAWVDVNIGVISLGLGASPPDKVVLTGGIYTIGFDGVATTEEVFGSVEIPHEWVEGTDIYPHVHWIPATTDTGNVKWQLEYTWTNSSQAEPASTTVSVTSAAPGSITNTRADFAAISGTGKTINSQFTFRLFRDPTDAADTYAHDALVKTFGIHLQVNTHGSRTQSAK